MSQQGPIIVVSSGARPSFAAALDEAKLFPVIDTEWADAGRAVEQLQPAAIIAATPETPQPGFQALAKQVAARQPYLPLIAIDPRASLPENAKEPDEVLVRRAQDGDMVAFEELVARHREKLFARAMSMMRKEFGGRTCALYVRSAAFLALCPCTICGSYGSP